MKLENRIKAREAGRRERRTIKALQRSQRKRTKQREFRHVRSQLARPATTDAWYTVRVAGESKDTDEHSAQETVTEAMKSWPRRSGRQSKAETDRRRAQWRASNAERVGEALETVIFGVEPVELGPFVLA